MKYRNHTIMKGPPITFRPDAQLRERMEQICIKDDRSMTWVIQKCVEGYLATLEARYGIKRIKEGAKE